MTEIEIEKLTKHIDNNFYLLKDRFKMSYDEFKAFALGYTLGAINALKTENKKKTTKL